MDRAHSIDTGPTLRALAEQGRHMATHLGALVKAIRTFLGNDEEALAVAAQLEASCERLAVELGPVLKRSAGGHYSQEEAERELQWLQSMMRVWILDVFTPQVDHAQAVWHRARAALPDGCAEYEALMGRLGVGMPGSR